MKRVLAILIVCSTLVGANMTSAAIGTHTLLQTDESLGNGASWAVGVYNDNNTPADANKASSSGADIRDLGTDGITDTSETTRKRIVVMKWDLGSIVGPGETISAITLSGTNIGQTTGALVVFYAAIDGGTADIQGLTLLETEITAMNWAGYNDAGPTTPGSFDSTIPLDLAQFTLVGSSPGNGGVYGMTFSDGDLLTAANADTNGTLIIAGVPTAENKAISLARGNPNSAIKLEVTVVPEPASLALLGLGGLSLLVRGRQ